MTAPQVQLDWSVMWCAKHLEPFRADWPGGAAVAMVGLFQAAMKDERLYAAQPKGADGKADPKSIEPILREHGPICCFLGDEVVARVVRDAGKEPTW